MLIAANKAVSIDYTLTNDAGEVIDSSAGGAPLVYLHGAGNIIAGGLIGMGVDAATGAATDHKPNPVIVTLQPRMAAPAGRAQRPPRRSAPPPAQPEAGT